MEENQDYRVALDAFEGPLDLLLYLIKKSEVDIYDIPIAEITNQYLQELERIPDLDVNTAGEFLVLASALVEIKARTILPVIASEDDEEGDDPRSDLVARLVEYRKYREIAECLRERGEREGLSFPRGFFERPEGEATDAGSIDVELWQLVRAFAKVLEETGAVRERTIYAEERPVAEFVAAIRGRLAAESRFAFRSLFGERFSRRDVIGLFLALLELVRMGEIRVRQEAVHGEIEIVAREVDRVSGAPASIPGGDPLTEATPGQ